MFRNVALERETMRTSLGEDGNQMTVYAKRNECETRKIRLKTEYDWTRFETR